MTHARFVLPFSTIWMRKSACRASYIDIRPCQTWKEQRAWPGWWRNLRVSAPLVRARAENAPHAHSLSRAQVVRTTFEKKGPRNLPVACQPRVLRAVSIVHKSCAYERSFLHKRNSTYIEDPLELFGFCFIPLHHEFQYLPGV